MTVHPRCFALSDEDYARLEALAWKEKVTVSELLRRRLSGLATEISPREVQILLEKKQETRRMAVTTIMLTTSTVLVAIYVFWGF